MDRLVLDVDLTRGRPDEAGLLNRFLRSGPLDDAGLHAAIRRLARYHDAWLMNYPLGGWDRGLSVTHEMRLITETYLPMREIRTAFRQLYRAALGFPPLLSSCPVHRASGWLDLLPFFHRYLPASSPAALLSEVAADDDLRCRLLFHLFLPPRYGCGFGRYPRQLAHLRDRLAQERSWRIQKTFRCLDAATGTGEGTYDLAQLLTDAGYPPDSVVVHGSTPEPFELIAGACCRFPHDPLREARFRDRLQRLAEAGTVSRITFMQGDVRDTPGDGGSYDLIVCNGLLGGPLLHDADELRRALAVLTDCLTPGGLLCIADRFHDGWRRRDAGPTVKFLLQQAGLETADLADGVVAVRPF